MKIKFWMIGWLWFLSALLLGNVTHPAASFSYILGVCGALLFGILGLKKDQGKIAKFFSVILVSIAGIVFLFLFLALIGYLISIYCKYYADCGIHGL